MNELVDQQTAVSVSLTADSLRLIQITEQIGYGNTLQRIR